MQDRALIQKLLNRIAAVKFLDNFKKKAIELNIKSYELSRAAGKIENAFSKTYSEMEDPRLSSFLRFWHAALNIVEARGEKADELNFNSLIDSELKEILTILNDINEADLKEFLRRHREFFLGLYVYVQLLKNKKAAAEEEIDAYERNLKIIAGDGNSGN